MDIITADVKTIDHLDIVKEMIEELEWLRFFYKEAGIYFENCTPFMCEGLRKKYDKLKEEQTTEEDLHGMC